MPHTVPNSPTNGPAEATVARNSRLDFEPFDLARDGNVEHFVDAGVQAAKRGRRVLERALPFAHGGDEQRRRGGVRLLRQLAIEFFERLAGPEHLLEAVHLGTKPPEQQRLVDDDRPGPERGGEQPDHHDLDDGMRRPEHRQQGCFRSVVHLGRNLARLLRDRLFAGCRCWLDLRARRRLVRLCAAIGPKLWPGARDPQGGVLANELGARQG